MNLVQLRTVARTIEAVGILSPDDLRELTQAAATGILLGDVIANPKSGVIGKNLDAMRQTAHECAHEVLKP
jgi:hypothetical protein